MYRSANMRRYLGASVHFEEKSSISVYFSVHSEQTLSIASVQFCHDFVTISLIRGLGGDKSWRGPGLYHSILKRSKRSVLKCIEFLSTDEWFTKISIL